MCPPLKAQSGESGKGDSSPLIFQQNSRSEVRQVGGDGQVTGAVTSEPGAQCQNRVAGGGSSYQVRRLTPRECERLQGFPDDWTLIPWKKVKRRRNYWEQKGDEYRVIDGQLWMMAPDGPRYKAIGNSKAIPVIAWIGQRIQSVEEIRSGR